MTRAEIQLKIQELVKTIQVKDGVKAEIAKWLIEKKVSEFDQKQILNDLTGYKEYLELEK